jgi:hypothetical protein
LSCVVTTTTIMMAIMAMADISLMLAAAAAPLQQRYGTSSDCYVCSKAKSLQVLLFNQESFSKSCVRVDK